MFDPKLTINQLTQANNGINRLQVMVGAHGFSFNNEKNYVQFSFKAKALKGIKNCLIQLREDDTYNVIFGKITQKADPKLAALGVVVKIPTFTKIDEFEGVYCDDLKAIFEQVTGLRLSL